MSVIDLGPRLALIDIVPPGNVIRDGILGCYVIKGEKIALVDPGPATSLPKLMSGLSALGIAPQKIEYLLCTHIHLDHSGSLGAALKLMPRATAVVHEKGIPHLINPTRLWESSLKTLESVALGYGQPEPVDPIRLIAAQEGMLIDLGGFQLEALFTPGHASHHICFLESDSHRLFAGDAAGIRPRDTGVLQPASPPPFDLKLAFSSLNKLLNRQPWDICYAHFGSYPEGVNCLQEYQQMLLAWSRVIAQHLDVDFDWQLIYQNIQSQWESASLETTPANEVPSDRFFTEQDIRGIWEYLRKAGVSTLSELQ